MRGDDKGLPTSTACAKRRRAESVGVRTPDIGPAGAVRLQRRRVHIGHLPHWGVARLQRQRVHIGLVPRGGERLC